MKIASNQSAPKVNNYKWKQKWIKPPSSDHTAPINDIAISAFSIFFSCISYHSYETNNLSSAVLGHNYFPSLKKKTPIFSQLGSLLWSQDICFAYSCCTMLILLPRNRFHAISIPISILQADRPIRTAALEDFGHQKMRRIWAVD